MVPLRFIVENFAGEVSVDSKTKDITVIKETAGDNSIKDFSLLLKKTTKEIVGDSYYTWSMRMPKDVKISYRSFNGSYNVFEAVDSSYSIGLSIYDLPANENFDTLVAGEQQYASGYTLLSQEKLKKNGLDYLKIAYKDDECIYEERDFIKGNKVYELYLQIEDADKYKNNKELAALLDSFIPEFKKDNKIEDLSDVTKDGYRIYEDKKLKYSMKIPADWYESVNAKKENEVAFTEPAKGISTSSDVLSISMYSLEDGFTLDNWEKRELQRIKDDFNPALVKNLKAEDIMINGIKAKKTIYSMKLKNQTSYIYNVFLLGKNYRYELYYSTTKSYDNAIMQNNINSLLGTFAISEPDSAEVGEFLDPKSITKSEGVRLIENKENGFSYEIPISWSNASSNDTNTTTYTNSDKTMSMLVITKKGITEQQYVEYLENDLKETAATTNDLIYNGKESINDKGTKITKFNVSLINGELVHSMQYYIISKNNTIYEFALTLADVKASEKNKKIISDIWTSLKFK
jgi:hypothetical protein